MADFISKKRFLYIFLKFNSTSKIYMERRSSPCSFVKIMRRIIEKKKINMKLNYKYTHINSLKIIKKI